MSDAVETGVTDQDEREDDEPIDAPVAIEVLEYLVKALVADPAAVEVDLDARGRRPVLNVHVGEGDMGRVIGKRGRVAQSIRTVVRAAAVRDGIDVEVEFVD
ncbi:MAG: KH domain-containing protein [Acidimicrobiales bacterium]|nr:KH domain-containing protein [Acidimicrobiales bacterium]